MAPVADDVVVLIGADAPEVAATGQPDSRSGGDEVVGARPCRRYEAGGAGGYLRGGGVVDLRIRRNIEREATDGVGRGNRQSVDRIGIENIQVERPIAVRTWIVPGAVVT